MVEAAGEDAGSGGQPVQYPSPISDGEYVDGVGVRWRLRGAGDVRWSRVEQLVRDRRGSVLHVYRDEIRDIDDPRELDELLERVRRHVKGVTPDDGYTSFRVAEFKDTGGRSMVVVEESC